MDTRSISLRRKLPNLDDYMEDKDWKGRIEQEMKSQSTMLVDIFKELKDGEFTKGVFSTVRDHTRRLDDHDDRLEDHQKTIDKVRLIEKLSYRTFIGILTTIWSAIVSFFLWLWFKLSPLIKAAVVLGATNNNHNT